MGDQEMSEKARRRRLLLVTMILLVGLPLYFVVASGVVGYFSAPTIENGEVVKPLHWLVELVIYLVIGLVWAFPLKGLVQGLGRAGGQ